MIKLKRLFKVCLNHSRKVSFLVVEFYFSYFLQHCVSGILRSYPDLAGKLAKEGQLTGESLHEHSQADLDKLTDEEEAMMARLNSQYKEKFGFPFVICARMNKKDAIIEGLKARSSHPVETEVQIGIGEVMKICELRLKDIVKSQL